MLKIIKYILKTIPVIAVIIASISLCKTCKNEKKIEVIEQEFLDSSSKDFSKEIEIIRPYDNGSIKLYTAFTFDATYKNTLPEKYKLWIIGRHNGYYDFLGPQKSLHISKIDKKLSRSGIKIEEEGEWEIMLCLVTNKSEEELKNHNHRINLKELPTGISILKTIKINANN